MAPGSRALSRNWSTGSNLSAPAAAAVGTVRFSKSLSYVLNLNVPNTSSTDNAEGQPKDGARSFREKGSVSLSALITGLNLMAKRNPSEKATHRPGTGPSTKSLPGPTTSLAATITDRNKLGLTSSLLGVNYTLNDAEPRFFILFFSRTSSTSRTKCLKDPLFW